MSKRASRSAKLLARKLISRTIEKDSQADLNTASAKDTPDTFGHVNDKKTVPPPLLQDDDLKLELTQCRMTCQWKSRPYAKKNCGKMFDTVEELLSHFIKEHKNSTSKGYTCRWSSCHLKKSKLFAKESELEEHVKEDILSAPFTVSSVGDTTTRNDQPSKGEIDPDFIDSSDEEATPKKKRKTQGSERVLQNVGLESSNPVCLSFYRFTCLWIVPFTMKNKDGKKVTADVTCMRKFTVIDESFNHLVGHHLEKMKDEKLPMKCCWKSCNEKKVFTSIDSLKEHVKVHIEEKMLKINPTGTVPMESFSGPSQLRSSLSTSKESSSNLKGQVEFTIKKTGSQNTKVISEVEQNWMDSVILSLTSTNIDSDHQICNSSKRCYFCLFVSWKERLQNESEICSLPHEFAELKKASQGVFKSPSTFVDHLLKIIACDELGNHNTSGFKNTFCFESLKYVKQLRCKMHKIRDETNLSDIFSPTCKPCTKEINSWHNECHENLVLYIDQGGKDALHYPVILTICEQEYRLRSVVVHGTDLNEVYRFFDNTWIKNWSSLKTVDESEVLKNGQAVLVVYTLIKTPSETEVPVVGKSPQKETEPPQNLDTNYKSPDSTQMEVCQKYAADTTSDVDGIPPQCIVKIEESGIKEEMRSNFNVGEAFTYRTIASESLMPSLFAVLQIIFQTTLTGSLSNSINYQSCPSDCLYCAICNIISRVLGNTNDLSVDCTHNLTQHLGDVSHLQDDPALLMHDLVTRVVEDELKYHKGYSTKYMFMMQVQKKSCSCMMSSEEYQWTVQPEKKHDDLLHLLGNMTKKCLSCAKLTSVHPISMPENLIIAIRRADHNPEASVHFPDEWASCNGRYILAAVIVQEPCSPTASPWTYVCYCKVFGKWMRYNGNVVNTASSADVLGNENACLLLYVTNEITLDMLMRNFDYDV